MAAGNQTNQTKPTKPTKQYEDVSKSGWGFGRRGGVAHNSDGAPFASKNLNPWFLKVSEV